MGEVLLYNLTDTKVDLQGIVLCTLRHLCTSVRSAHYAYPGKECGNEMEAALLELLGDGF